MIATVLSGCSTIGRSGPSTGAVLGASKRGAEDADIQVVRVDEGVVKRILAMPRAPLLSEVIGDGVVFGSRLGHGDVVDISVWEAAPAVLFGTVVSDPRLSMIGTGTRNSSLPEQMVNSDGKIEVPYIGMITAAGRTPSEVGNEIARRLDGLAHDPQVIVRLVRNAAANVTVVGEVTNSTRMQITPKGERLLDALASAGGVRQPVGKMTIQVTRGPRVASLPLDAIIRDPAQNIRLQADDVVTAMYQPYSFTALGAVGNNAEVPFEGVGLTLAQALGRVGGLRDDRADVKGVFIFRFEDPATLDPAVVYGPRRTADGKIPVIYRVDLRDPGSFFMAQSFPIRNRDVLYVSNAPVADLQKFIGIVSSAAFSIIGVTNSL